MDENGEPSVDSFPLPSGCICHHMQNDPNLRRAYIFNNKTEEKVQNVDTSNHSDINLRFTQVNAPIDLICSTDEEFQISLTNGRIRRNNGIIIFPDEPVTSIVDMSSFKRNDDLSERSNVNLVELFQRKEMIRKVEPCPNGDSFCQLLASYPKNFINAAVNRSNQLNNLQPYEFNQYHSSVCQDSSADIVAQRVGTFENGEVPLCVSVTEIIHPQKGRNIHGEWRHIVNTDIYMQGVSLNRCVKNFEGQSCLYGGNMGLFPEATICKQQYTTHPFVVISSSGEKKVELFRIPTACVCHIQDESFF
uniref:Putative LOC100875017 [Megachile rotundata] n=1 Tax=Lepeophtheirus salmonis TaxID=72036 RepID=A0A0K2VC96_LEPSM